MGGPDGIALTTSPRFTNDFLSVIGKGKIHQKWTRTWIVNLRKDVESLGME